MSQRKRFDGTVILRERFHSSMLLFRLTIDRVGTVFKYSLNKFYVTYKDSCVQVGEWERVGIIILTWQLVNILYASNRFGY